MNLSGESVYEVFEHQKAQLLMHLLAQNPQWNRSLVLVRSRKDLHELTAEMHQSGKAMAVDSIHGQKKPELRDRTLKDFADGALRILVTNEASVRDLELPSLDCVIYFDPPELNVDYTKYRDVVTAGGGAILLLVHTQDKPLISRLESDLGRNFPRKEAESFAYDSQPQRQKSPRKKGGKSKGVQSKPLQNKKPKLKNKWGKK